MFRLGDLLLQGASRVSLFPAAEATDLRRRGSAIEAAVPVAASIETCGPAERFGRPQSTRSRSTHDEHNARRGWRHTQRARTSQFGTDDERDARSLGGPKAPVRAEALS